MPRSEKQKLKLLYLRDYLRQNTDEKRPASVQQLIDYLASKDIRAERNFLASGEGENAEPKPGTWSFFDELEME